MADDPRGLPPDSEISEALAQYWNALARGETPDPGGLEPALAEEVRLLHVLGAASAPNPAFVARLKEDLVMAASTIPLVLDPGLHAPANGRVDPRRRVGPRSPALPQRGRWAQGYFATALLLVVTLLAVYVAFFAGGQQQATPPVDASSTPAASPSPAASIATQVNATFPASALPAGSAEVDFYRWTLTGGLVTTREPGNFPAGVRVDLVVAGAYTARVDGPLLVVRSGTTAAAPESIAPGTAVTLGPGDAAIYPENDRGQTWGNAGAEPLVLLVAGVFATALPEPPVGLTPEGLGTIAPNEWADAYSVPPGPVMLTLRRLTLAPGAALPEYTAVGPELIGIETGSLGVTRTGSPLPPSAPSGQEVVRGSGEAFRVAPRMQVALRNAGDKPLVLVVLALTPAEGGTGTPSTAET
jgi:hypothetical protein